MHGKIKHKSPAYFVTSLQSYTKDEEYPYASPTTHLDARLSSKYHRSHVSDIGTGSCSTSRVAHLGEISELRWITYYLEINKYVTNNIINSCPQKLIIHINVKNVVCHLIHW